MKTFRVRYDDYEAYCLLIIQDAVQYGGYACSRDQAYALWMQYTQGREVLDWRNNDKGWALLPDDSETLFACVAPYIEDEEKFTGEK